jgi:hypothetical protein
VSLRLTNDGEAARCGGGAFNDVFTQRLWEANEFYDALAPADLSSDARLVQRQAFAGLLWSKQFYHYDISRWLKGDPAGPEPPRERLKGRNADWTHLYNADVVSMPDKWEYPWYAAWDLAFHCIPLAVVDPTFAKEQLILMLREWYMHPNGQIPAYEWAFGDVNPPVHAWAAWRVYKIEKKRKGAGDRVFLERVFHKLLLNFTWWVNRKDAEGKNIFQGGFLGLDNIGVFDRSAPLPTGGHIEQSDATSWMGMYCLNMLSIALELARGNRAYEDVASKFFEHFVYICRAMNNIGGEQIELWDREDGFFYDVLHLPDGKTCHMKVRSMVGLIPLFAVETLDWWPACRGSSTGCSGSSRTSPISARTWRRKATTGACGAFSPSSTAIGCGPYCAICWTSRNSSRPTASAPSPATTRTTRMCSRRWAASIASIMSRPNPAPVCSAAIATGGGPSGSR